MPASRPKEYFAYYPFVFNKIVAIFKLLVNIASNFATSKVKLNGFT
jgi:hypothetical protein